MYPIYLNNFPDSKNVGIIDGFMFDEDSDYCDHYYIEDLISEEEEKLIEAYLGSLPNLDWNSKKDQKILRKVQRKRDSEFEKLVKSKKFHKKAVFIVKQQAASEFEKLVDQIQKKIKKSKHSVLVATTNHTCQLKAEKALKQLGFKIKLTFTNPNHEREDTLHLWILEKKSLKS